MQQFYKASNEKQDFSNLKVVKETVYLLGNEFENMEAIVAGWGRLSEQGEQADVLMEAKVLTVITRRFVYAVYNQSFFKIITLVSRNFFCI